VTVSTSDVERLQQQVTMAIAAHSPRADSVFHNGGTVLALAATGTATFLPGSYGLWARVASAIATFVIALSRALDFGARWRWHVEMRNAYTALLDRTSLVMVLPDADRLEVMKTLYADLVELRLRENRIPGAGAPATLT
jgi:hypothetical protein